MGPRCGIFLPVSRAYAIIALVLVLAGGIALRSARISADAPAVFPGGLSSSAPVKDEAAKCYAARNRVLFNEWSTDPVDDYRYWETLSPAWTWSLFFWLKAWGVGYPQARAFSILWSALSILGIYAALSARSRKAALWGAFFFAMNFSAAIFGRLAILETCLNCLLIICLALLSRPGSRTGLVLFACLAWVAAWLVKQSAVVFLPVLAAGGILAWRGPGKEGRGRSWLALLLVAGAALAACAFLFDFDYRIRTIMNVRHVLDYKPDPGYMWMRTDPARTWLAIKENLTSGLLRGYLLVNPVAGPLAVVELVLIGAGLWKRKKIDDLSILAAIWWLSARAALTVAGQASPRFQLLQFPSTAVLAALALARLEGALTSGSFRRKAAPVMTGLIIVACGVAHLVPWAGWVKADPREVERGTMLLGRTIEADRAVVVGEWAGPLCFETRHQYYYLKNVFNRTADQVRTLGITHVVVDEDKESGLDIDPAVRRIRKYFPSVYERRVELGRISLWEGSADETTLILYSVDFKELEGK